MARRSPGHSRSPRHEVRRSPDGGKLLAALGQAVRAARDGQGISRRALALRANISARYLAQLEAGAGNISVGRLDTVARVLGSSAAAMLAGNGGGGAVDPPPGPAKGEADGEADGLRREMASLAAHCSADRLRGALALLRGEATPPPLIALVGLRGAGKSTLGALLAARLEIPFHELDDLIGESGGLAVPEIFELHGESYYRNAERRELGRLIAAGHPAVVAVSGGIVNDAAAFALLKNHTRLVWVRASPAQHMARVEAQGDHRPMRDRPNAMAELKALLGARLPLYRQAAIVIDTARAGPERCVERLATALGD